MRPLFIVRVILFCSISILSPFLTILCMNGKLHYLPIKNTRTRKSLFAGVKEKPALLCRFTLFSFVSMKAAWMQGCVSLSSVETAFSPLLIRALREGFAVWICISPHISVFGTANCNVTVLRFEWEKNVFVFEMGVNDQPHTFPRCCFNKSAPLPL